MAQANTTNSTSMPVDSTRRRFLTSAAGIAAGGAAVVLAAVPALALPVDPIFAAIAAHRKAAAAFWTEDAKPTGGGFVDGVAQAALRATLAAAKALMGTAPTTRAGLRALELHLCDERNSIFALHFINRPGTPLERAARIGAATSEAIDREDIDWLVAKYAAEIAQ